MIEVIVGQDGTVTHMLNGQPHNDAGPAVIHPNGDYAYYQRGLLHNTSGPAARYGNTTVWCLRGQYMTKEVWERTTGHLRSGEQQ